MDGDTMVEDMFDPASPHEAVRRDVHTRLIIKSTGLLPVELKDRTFPRVLDIGCSTGTWIYEMSFQYPQAWFIGTDPTLDMVQGATIKNALRAHTSFEVWDPFSSDPAPFPDNHFDLITLHFASQWVTSPLAWLQLLNSCRLYLRSGGVLLIQDNDGITTTSDALTRLSICLAAADKKTGHTLSWSESRGGIVVLMRLLRQAHFPSPVVSCASVDFSYAHEEENFAWRDYLRVYIHQLTPYLTGAGVVTAEELCELSIRLDGEMFKEDFCGIWTTFCMSVRKP